MIGSSVKELNQYRKARTKINNIINQYENIENLNKLVHLHKSDRSNNQNLTLKAANTAVRNYQNHRKKVKISASKYGNIDDDLNHCALAK